MPATSKRHFCDTLTVGRVHVHPLSSILGVPKLCPASVWHHLGLTWDSLGMVVMRRHCPQLVCISILLSQRVADHCPLRCPLVFSVRCIVLDLLSVYVCVLSIHCTVTICAI